MSVALYVHPDGEPDRAIVVDVRPDQDVTVLSLGLAEIFGIIAPARLWLREASGYTPLGDDVGAYTIGEFLPERQMHTVVLSEQEPSVLSGRTA